MNIERQKIIKNLTNFRIQKEKEKQFDKIAGHIDPNNLNIEIIKNKNNTITNNIYEKILIGSFNIDMN